MSDVGNSATKRNIYTSLAFSCNRTTHQKTD